MTVIPRPRVREILVVLNAIPSGEGWEHTAKALPEYTAVSHQRAAFVLADGTVICLGLDGWEASRNPGNDPDGPTWIMGPGGTAAHIGVRCTCGHACWTIEEY